jgi:hypothetical protein
MQQNCPDCNTELVSSAVGLLCPGCGGLHHFDKMSSSNGSAVAIHTANQPLPAAHDTVKVEKPVKKLLATPKPKKPAQSHTKPAKYSLKHHMKRLMVPELPAPHVSDYSHDGNIADTQLAAPVAAQQVTDISRKKYDETFVRDTGVAIAASAAASKKSSSHEEKAKVAQVHEEWKHEIDDTPGSFVASRSIIMIIAAILLLVAAYLAVFWFRVV